MVFFIEKKSIAFYLWYYDIFDRSRVFGNDKNIQTYQVYQQYTQSDDAL